VNASTGRAIPDATVAGDSSAVATTTDGAGRFALQPEKAIIGLTVTHPGFEASHVSLDSVKTPLRIALTPLATLPGVQVVATSPPSSNGDLTKDDLDRADGLSLVDAINTVPGVFMQTRTPFGGARITIRGYYPSTTGNSPNSNGLGYQTFLDNIPITDATGTTVLDDIDYATLSNVQVIKGPSSSLYGSFIGGTVLMTTAKPNLLGTAVTQQIEGGSYDLLRSTTTLDHASADGSDFSLTYAHQGFDSFRPHSESDKEYWHGSGDFRVGSDQYISGYVSYNRSFENLAGEIDSTDFYARLPVSDANYLANNSAINLSSVFAGITDDYSINDHFSNQTTVFGSGRSSDQPFAHGFTDANQYNLGARTAFNYQTQVGIVGLRGTLGGMLQRSNVTSNGVFIIPAPPNPEIPSDQENYAVNGYLFTEWNVSLPSQVVVTVGGSLNKNTFAVHNLLVKEQVFDTTATITKSFGAVFAPRVAVSKGFGDQLAVFGDISAGYTPPQLSDVVASDGTINTALKPERAIQYELGAREALLDKRLTGELTLYDLENSDKLLSETVNSVTFTTNAGEQRNRGVEASLSYLILNDLRPWVSYTYTDARYIDFQRFDGNQVARVPKNFLTAGLDVHGPLGFYANGTFQHVDKVPVTFDNSTWVHGYDILGAKVGYKTVIRERYRIDASVGGDNLTNETYYTFLFVGPNYKGLAQGPDGGTGDGYILPAPYHAAIYANLTLSYVF
jgi:iron complex outermembrane recepter protein